MTIDFARDGHVLDLALERFMLEDLADPERRAVKAHLRECELCRGRADQIRLDLSVALPPLDATRAPEPEPDPAPPAAWVGIGIGGALGMVTVLLWLMARGC